MQDTIEVSGVWIRRIGDHVELLVEVDGQWRLAARERFDGNFSHIVEAPGIRTAPRDKVPST